MSTRSNIEVCKAYLRKYAEKDIEGIAALFSDTIILRDWKIRVVGKKWALKETQKNFDAVSSLDIAILETYENKNTVAAELRITIDGQEELFVVDVITFNEEQKITSIRAYLGRGDT